MILKDRQTLSAYMDRLLSNGQVAFTSDEAKQALGLKHRAFLDAAERQQRQQRLIGLIACKGDLAVGEQPIHIGREGLTILENHVVLSTKNTEIST